VAASGDGKDPLPPLRQVEHGPRKVRVADLVAFARADVPPDLGVQRARIGDVNNPAYPGDPDIGTNAGHGSVASAYRMSDLETTTGPWPECVNTFATRGYMSGACESARR